MPHDDASQAEVAASLRYAVMWDEAEGTVQLIVLGPDAPTLTLTPDMAAQLAGLLLNPPRPAC